MGYKFWVIGQGSTGYFHGNLTELNLENPVYRDTVTLEAFRWIVLRFVADNVGLWALHCKWLLGGGETREDEG
jgi:FtsP/CotA-like multicopper oxidase with cupredoxin domain